MLGYMRRSFERWAEAGRARDNLRETARALGADPELAVERADWLVLSTSLDTIGACERVADELRGAAAALSEGELRPGNVGTPSPSESASALRDAGKLRDEEAG